MASELPQGQVTIRSIFLQGLMKQVKIKGIVKGGYELKPPFGICILAADLAKKTSIANRICCFIYDKHALNDPETVGLVKHMYFDEMIRLSGR